MTGVLLYQPNPRWRIGAALGAAALLHLAAIALASIHPRERIDEVPSTPGITEVVFDPSLPVDDPTPPPDPVAPTPSQDTTDQLFADENSTPPPIRQQDNKRVTPIVKRSNPSSGSLSLSSAKIVALSAPRPEYPYEARRQRITGSGIVAMTVDPATGMVTEVSMWQSTGSPYLDNAAITGFRRWRFKPGTAFKIKSPITYTLTGAAY
jgi:periplasmic protein TonB